MAYPPVAPSQGTGASPGRGIMLSATLGYLLTDTSFLAVNGQSSASSIVKNAIKKSETYWASVALSTYSLSPNESNRFLTGTYPKRCYEAAYYYALEFIAEEYIRLRLGQLGLTPNSRFVDLILSKADKLFAVAQNGIKAYEEWCLSTASLICADTIEQIQGYCVDVNEGMVLAASFWSLVPSDIQSTAYSDSAFGSLGAQFENMKAEFALGHSMRKVGLKLTQRTFGKTSGRNPEVGRYYSQAGQLLIQQGTTIMDSWKSWAEKNKLQLSTMALGL